MRMIKEICFIALILSGSIVSGCKSDMKLVEDSAGQSGSFEKHVSTTPFPVGAPHVFYTNIPYGIHGRNVLDLWVPDGDQSAGLVVFIHGGGFQGGDKSSAWEKTAKFGIGPDQIDRFLSEGISFASINYRLLEKTDKEGVIKCLNDSKRAVQFLRYHAADLDFDGENIGLAGTSAGAGTGLWMAFHDDMADADSDNPVLRQSTRVNAIAAQETQSTYDIMKWSEEVFPNDIFSLERIKGTALGNRLMVFYGVNDLGLLESNELTEYRKQVNILGMISSDDPPVYILNKKDFKPEKGKLVGNLLHSPYHAVALKKKIEEEGISNEIYIPAEGTKPKPDQTMADFLIRQLK